MGHGIEAVQHVDVVIGMNLGLLPFCIFEGVRGQRAQGGTLNVFELIAARPADPFKDRQSAATSQAKTNRHTARTCPGLNEMHIRNLVKPAVQLH